MCYPPLIRLAPIHCQCSCTPLSAPLVVTTRNVYISPSRLRQKAQVHIGNSCCLLFLYTFQFSDPSLIFCLAVDCFRACSKAHSSSQLHNCSFFCFVPLTLLEILLTRLLELSTRSANSMRSSTIRQTVFYCFWSNISMQEREREWPHARVFYFFHLR